MKTTGNKKVLLGPSTFAVYDKTPKEKLEKAGYEIIDNPFGRKLTKNELLDLLPGVVGIVAGLEPLDKDVLQKSSLKVISRCGAGLSNVNMLAAKELGIKVCTTPDAPVNSVAELSLGAILSLIRMIPFMDKNLHEGKWTKTTGRLLDSKTVAIVGFGRIGKRLGQLLRPFNVNILVVDPFLSGTVGGLPVVKIEEALPQADIVSIHCSGEKCIIGNKEFEILKTGTYLFNAARGGVIDERALAKFLENGKVAGAWLDTFEQEPYEGPLTKFKQVVLTPHVGSYTIECRKQMENEAVDNLIREFN